MNIDELVKEQRAKEETYDNEKSKYETDVDYSKQDVVLADILTKIADDDQAVLTWNND